MTPYDAARAGRSSPARPASSWRSPRRSPSASPARWRARCSTPAGRAGAVVLCRIALGALVVVPFGVRALRGRWHLLRDNAGLIVRLRPARGRRRAVRLLLRGRAHAGRAGAAHRVHRARRRRRLVLAAPRPAPRRGHPRRRRGLRARPGARARPALGRRPQHRPACCGRWPRWSAARPTSSSTATTPPACRRSSLAAGGLVVGAAALGLLGLVGLMPMRATSARVAYAGIERRLVGADARARPGHRRGRLRHRHRRRAACSARGWRRSSR